MLAIPAIDLREGCVVQLVGGDFEKEKIRLGDPRDVARRWAGYGFSRLHVVDLDAAAGRGDNRAVLRDLLADRAVPAQVGGGVRMTQDVESLFSDGADRVVVGTRAIEDLEWLREIADVNPGAIVLAADVRDRRIVTHGWTRELPRNILDLIDDLSGVPLGGLLVTAVHREGQMAGTDMPLMEDVAEASEWPVFASGGISSMPELRALEDRGLAGAVLGMALYTGALDPRVLVEEFPRMSVRKIVERTTKETTIRVEAAIGAGTAVVDTTVPFLDHMMTALARYSGIDLTIKARGDLRHHIVEDVALTVGQAVAALIPNGAARYGERTVPMDDALVQAVLDVGGRPFYRGPIPSTFFEHWMRSFCDAGKFTLHLRVLRGEDRHHVVEAGFKALGFSLAQAMGDTGRVFSTKGRVSVRAKGRRPQ